MVIGQKSGKDNVLLTLLERKTRDFSIMRLPDKSADSVLDAFQKLQSELGDYFSKVFRTITTDNGSEFARLSELEEGTSTKVYFAHPYTSCEKGAVENHNGLIRRFIPKGKRISDYSDDDIFAVDLLWSCGRTLFPERFSATRHRTKHLEQRWMLSTLRNHPPTSAISNFLAQGQPRSG